MSRQQTPPGWKHAAAGLIVWFPSIVFACGDPNATGDALALVRASHLVLVAETAAFREEAQTWDWQADLTLGYATNTTFEPGAAGGSAALRVRIPLFDPAWQRETSQARAALRHTEDGVFQAFLADLERLCAQAEEVRGLATLRAFHRDRLKYRQEQVDAGLAEADALWAEAEQAERAEQQWRQAAAGLNTLRLRLARQYGGEAWSRLQALLAAMTR